MSFNVEPVVERKLFKQVVTDSVVSLLFKEVLTDERKKKELINQIEKALLEEKDVVTKLRKKKKHLLQSKKTQEERLVKLDSFLTKLKAKSLSKEEVVAEMKQLLDS